MFTSIHTKTVTKSPPSDPLANYTSQVHPQN